MPEAVTATGAVCSHDADPPPTVGAAGAVRSIRTVAVTQLLACPETSSARNRTSFSPSAVTVMLAAIVAGPQVTPPSVDTWRW